jgi:hypothetical protein
MSTTIKSPVPCALGREVVDHQFTALGEHDRLHRRANVELPRHFQAFALGRDAGESAINRIPSDRAIELRHRDRRSDDAATGCAERLDPLDVARVGERDTDQALGAGPRCRLPP